MMVTDQLLPDEKDHLFKCSPITTVTYFSIAPSDGAGATISHVDKVISARVRELLSDNAWLTGSLSNKSGEITLQYNEVLPKSSVYSVEPYYSVAFGEDVALTPTMDNEVLLKRLIGYGRAPLLVEYGSQCLNKVDAPLFHVSLIASRADAAEFAIVVSLSHTIGDAFTHSKILNGILGTSSERRTHLTSQRMLKFEEISESSIDRVNEYRRMFKMPSFIVGAIYKVYLNPCRPRLRMRRYEIDSEWIREQKENHVPTDAAPFITTNDIVTSWFFRTGEFESGLMILNLRDRIDNVSTDMAGNYIKEIFYFPEMFATPAGVRAPLTNGFKTSRQGEIPGMGARFRCKMGMVTSWVFPFSQDLSLPGCETVSHVPIIHYSLGHTFSFLDGCCFIYKPSPTTTGVLIIETLGSSFSERHMLSDPAIKRAL